jgi:hypothetical protein
MPYGGSGYGGIFTGTAPTYVDRSQMVNQSLDRLLQGLNAAQQVHAQLKLAEEQRLALSSPTIMSLMGSLPGGATPGGAPSLGGLEDQFRGANLGAATMGPTLGLSVQPPRGLMPAASGATPVQPSRAVDQFPGVTVGMGPIEMMGAPPPTSAPGMAPPQGGFSEDMLVNGLTPRNTGMADMRGAMTRGRAPPFANITEYNIFRELLPYATQRDVAMMQTEGANRRTDVKANTDLTKNQTKLSVDLLKLAETRRNLETRLSADMEKIRLKAKLKTGTGAGSGLKELEFLRKNLALAQGGAQGAMQLAATYDGLGGAAAEQGSPLRMNYDGAIAEVKRYQILEQQYRTLLESAMTQGGLPPGGQPSRGPQKGLGRSIESVTDVSAASNAELVDYLRANGLMK